MSREHRGPDAAALQRSTRGRNPRRRNPALGTSVEWLEAMSPWPRDGFGLGRMRELLHELGDPQEAYPAIHVVGTNGKSTATITIEQLLVAEGLRVGSTISPHVASWSERIRLAGEAADFEAAVARVRPAAESLNATQFEAVTAAALQAFADANVDVAVVEAGLGGRHDATNVLRTRVVLLTNVGLEHTDVLGETVEEIATEKLAVARPGAVVVLPDRTYAGLVPDNEVVVGGARAAAEAFVGHAIEADPHIVLPGRFERREGEIRDGAHNPDGARHLVDQLDGDDFTIVASILGDKDVDAMLATLRRAGRRLVATRSSSARALPAADLAGLARSRFEHVEVVDDPVAAVARAHELGEPVLVTGSLYLLGDLAQAEQRAAWRG